MTDINNNKIYDYIIVGGGIAGLSSLHQIITTTDDKTVLCLEEGSVVGGKIKSERMDGYLIDHGPNAFLKSYKYLYSLISDLGLHDSVIHNLEGATNRFIVKRGKLIRFPEGPISFLKSPFLSMTAKFRLLLEPLTPLFRGEELTVYEFGKRHFGTEVAENIMDAVISGICAGDVKKLDMYSLFPKVREIEKKYRSILLFLMKFKKRNVKRSTDGPKQVFTSLKGGMGELTDALHKKYQEYIKHNCQVFNINKIQENESCYTVSSTGGEFKASNIIFATPSYITANLIKGLDKELSESLKKIIYTNMVTVMLGFDSADIEHKMDGFGFLIPRKEGMRIIGGLFSSTLFCNRAPEGKKSLKLYLGGEYDLSCLSLSDQEIINCIETEIYPLLKVKNSAEFLLIKRIENAIPQYNLGHRKNIEEIYAKLSNHSNLFLAGNYLKGISVNDAIKSGIQFEDKTINS